MFDKQYKYTEFAFIILFIAAGRAMESEQKQPTLFQTP